jgi:hypothetical protein
MAQMQIQEREIMLKRICVFLITLLVLISPNALAESVPYTFGDFTFQIPDTLYVLTRDKHDAIALGLENRLSQSFADTLFVSQPNLQMDCMHMDPFYEISVSQLPVTNYTDFSESAPEQLEDCQTVLKDDLQARQVVLTGEMQLFSLSQTKYYCYTGTTEMNGSTVYVTAYVTCENNVMTTIALQTYDGPAEENVKAFLDNIVQGSELNAVR